MGIVSSCTWEKSNTDTITYEKQSYYESTAEQNRLFAEIQENGDRILFLTKNDENPVAIDSIDASENMDGKFYDYANVTFLYPNPDILMYSKLRERDFDSESRETIIKNIDNGKTILTKANPNDIGLTQDEKYFFTCSQKNLKKGELQIFSYPDLQLVKNLYDRLNLGKNKIVCPESMTPPNKFNDESYYDEDTNTLYLVAIDGKKVTGKYTFDFDTLLLTEKLVKPTTFESQVSKTLSLEKNLEGETVSFSIKGKKTVINTIEYSNFPDSSFSEPKFIDERSNIFSYNEIKQNSTHTYFYNIESGKKLDYKGTLKDSGFSQDNTYLYVCKQGEESSGEFELYSYPSLELVDDATGKIPKDEAFTCR